MAEHQAVGVMIGVMGNLMNAFGYILQKKGWNSKPPGAKIWSSPIWVTGFVVYALGGIVFAIALGFASASLLLPLGGLKLAAFAALAPMCLGEEIAMKDAFGICLVIVGAAGAVLTGPSGTQSEEDGVQITERFTQLPFLLYIAATACGCMAAMWLARQLRKAFQDTEVAPSEALHTAPAKTLALLYSLLAGMFSAYGILCIKVVAESLATGMVPALAHPSFYVAIVAFLAANSGMEYFKQTGLALFPAMQIIPAIEVALLLLGIIATGLFYNEFTGATWPSLALFWGSIGLSALGIYFLSAAEAQKIPFNNVVKVAVTVNKAKLKFKRLLKKHDAANMEPEYASGNVSEHSTDPGLSPDLQLPGAHDEQEDRVPQSAQFSAHSPDSMSGSFQLGLMPLPSLSFLLEGSSPVSACGDTDEEDVPLIRDGPIVNG